MAYHISCRVWGQILKILDGMRGLHTEDEESLRQFLEGVWFVCRSGCQWRLLPVCYGNWRSVHRRFKRWSEKKIWEELMKAIADPDRETHMIDATIVRAHACSAGYKKDKGAEEALGRSKGGFTTKIHALVDALGNPLSFTLTAGQRHDITQAERLTQNLERTTLIADKGYDSNTLVENLQNKGCTVVIPPKKNRKNPRAYDAHIYKERHLIEGFFGKIKHFSRVFSRFDKTQTAFLGFLYFVSTFIWLK